MSLREIDRSKLAELSIQYNRMEEKLINLTRVVKLLQTYTENQEQETKNLINKFDEEHWSGNRFQHKTEHSERKHIVNYINYVG